MMRSLVLFPGMDGGVIAAIDRKSVTQEHHPLVIKTLKYTD